MNSIRMRKQKRYGKIRITEKVYEDFWQNLPAGDFIPLRIEALWISSEFELEGYSKHFVELRPCDNIPQYQPIFEVDKDTNKPVFKKFKKC